MKYTIDELQEFQEPSFSAPIPGMGLTAKLGSRPWDQPPKYPSVAEALDYYTDTLFSRGGVSFVADALQAGKSAIDVAEAVTMDGVQNGNHTIDVGVLILPAVAEGINMIGNMMGLEFEVGNEDGTSVVSDSMLGLIANRMSKSIEKDRGLADVLNLDDFELSDEDMQYLDMEDYETQSPEELPMADDEMLVEAMQEEAPAIPAGQGLMSRRS